ncbi:MAG: hypothetical protein AAGJ50_09195 [Pseudomonadota bacterium]
MIRLRTAPTREFDEHDADHFMGLAGKVAQRKIIYGGDCLSSLTVRNRFVVAMAKFPHFLSPLNSVNNTQ